MRRRSLDLVGAIAAGKGVPGFAEAIAEQEKRIQ
jgi:hypothetical protein